MARTHVAAPGDTIAWAEALAPGDARSREVLVVQKDCIVPAVAQVEEGTGRVKGRVRVYRRESMRRRGRHGEELSGLEMHLSARTRCRFYWEWREGCVSAHTFLDNVDRSGTSGDDPAYDLVVMKEWETVGGDAHERGWTTKSASKYLGDLRLDNL
jgi:hypothetical protein